MPFPAAGSYPTGLALRGLLAALLKEAAASASVSAGETTTSTSYTALTTAGPAVAITSVFDRALIFWSVDQFNNSAVANSLTTVEITGATTLTAATSNGAKQNGGATPSEENMQFMIVPINPGLNTYTMKYVVTGGTGLFGRRRLYVIAP